MSEHPDLEGRHEGESLAQYAVRISEKMRIHAAARRDAEPRYDLECHAGDVLDSTGLKVCNTAYPLNPSVTTNHRVMVIETTHLAGYQLRVIREAISLGEVPYDAVVNMRAGDPSEVAAITNAVTRQLMVSQIAEANAWLEANPEP